MRVIAGSKRRLLLKTIEGMDTRPTTDRIKETLFNMINDDLYDANILDIFAGSGQIGIEALSRGAKCCYFIDNSNRCIKCINENLEHTDLSDKAVVIQKDALSALEFINGKERFDLIFMDPPYNKELEKEVLSKLSETSLIDSDSMIVVEADIDTDFSYLDSLGFMIIREKKYKTNKHLFLRLT